MIGEMESIAVVGAGLIGSSWAAFFASKGLPVRLLDASRDQAEAGKQKADRQLDFLAEQGMLDPESHAGALARITTHENLSRDVADVDLVIEAVSESYETKIRTFEALDKATRPDCVLTSSSSSLLMTRIQAGLQYPQRTLIAHPFNPVHLIPLVELVPGERTDAAVVERVRDFLDGLGKTAVVLRKETPGFIGNRLQAAVWREAINLVREGVGSVADVDRALAAGPGLRWALLGQHLIFHLGGGEGGIRYFLDHVGVNFQVLWETMDDWAEIPEETWPLLTEGVQEELGACDVNEVAAWRDKLLAALVTMKREPKPPHEGA